MYIHKIVVLFLLRCSMSASDMDSPARSWRPVQRSGASSNSSTSDNSLEGWIGQFSAEVWEPLITAYDLAPTELQSALRCQVFGASLPMGMLIGEARRLVESKENVIPEDVKHERSRSRSPLARASPKEEEEERRIVLIKPEEQNQLQEEVPMQRPGRSCLICSYTPDHMRRHVEEVHLPYWFHGDAACLQCSRVFPTAAMRVDHDTRHHTEASMTFDGRDCRGYALWALSMVSLAEVVANTLDTSLEGLPAHFVTEEWCPSTESGVQFNVSLQSMLFDVARLAGFPCGWRYLDPTRPRHFIEILHWKSLQMFLASQNVGIQQQLLNLPLSSGSPSQALGLLGLPSAVDSHCHLAMLINHRGQSLCVTLERALERSLTELPRACRHVEVSHVRLIVDNRVFSKEWDPGCTSGDHQIDLPGEGSAIVSVAC